MEKTVDNKELVEFCEKMKKLKSPDYSATVSEIITELDLPEKTPCAKIEALLIKATNLTFGDSSFERDIVLAVFGLLQGFSHEEEPKDIQKRSMVRWRIDKFLMDSSYIQDNGKFDSWETAKEAVNENGNSEFVVIGDNLSKKVVNYIVKVAKKIHKLYKLGKIESFLEEASKEYPSSEKNYIDLGHLPQLATVQKDISKKNKSEQDYAKKQGKLFSRLARIIKRLLKGKEKIIIDARIVLAVGIVAFCLCTYLSTRMAGNEEETAPLIRNILVVTPEIQLYPGKEGLIQLDIAPDGADIDSINCIPEDTGVATVDHRIVTAQPEWQEENHETQITVYGGESPHRQVHVTVLPDPREQFTGADRPDGKPKRNEGKEGEQ